MLAICAGSARKCWAVSQEPPPWTAHVRLVVLTSSSHTSQFIEFAVRPPNCLDLCALIFSGFFGLDASLTVCKLICRLLVPLGWRCRLPTYEDSCDATTANTRFFAQRVDVLCWRTGGSLLFLQLVLGVMLGAGRHGSTYHSACLC